MHPQEQGYAICCLQAKIFFLHFKGWFKKKNKPGIGDRDICLYRKSLLTLRLEEKLSNSNTRSEPRDQI